MSILEYLPPPIVREAMAAGRRTPSKKGQARIEDPVFAEILPRKLRLLTPRERDVMRALILHGSYKRAAYSLGIAINTLSAHRTKICLKRGGSWEFALVIDGPELIPEFAESRASIYRPAVVA